MYAPKQIGIPRRAHKHVLYTETKPPKEFEELVYCTWELYTAKPLDNDFIYLILPDICTDIIFNLESTSLEKAFVMASDNKAEEINLGNNFHFVGIRFFPGVLARNYIHGPAHSRELIGTWQGLRDTKTEAGRHEILLGYIASLLDQGNATRNYLMHQVLSHSQDLHTVGDIEALTGYTRRQLQRIFHEQTGFAPREFLKIMRFQRALHDKGGDIYADQSHLIREFKRITGVTPGSFKTKY